MRPAFGRHVPGTGRMVPCRDCGAEVEISAWAYEFAQTTARGYLERRGEPPLEDGELTRCIPCSAAYDGKRLAEAIATARRVREIVRDATRTARLGEYERRWLISHGYAETAEGIDEFIARGKKGKKRDEEGTL